MSAAPARQRHSEPLGGHSGRQSADGLPGDLPFQNGLFTLDRSQCTGSGTA
ncbi:hypothetical protein ACFRR7_33090 [Streptomyces sp. NPDC056909]|uniref:hypothetical protein n=1 Tax=Streptomyces sp. NPDC056909 TaxID=3345963 RepID=UPI0036838C67